MKTEGRVSSEQSTSSDDSMNIKFIDKNGTETILSSGTSSSDPIPYVWYGGGEIFDNVTIDRKTRAGIPGSYPYINNNDFAVRILYALDHFNFSRYESIGFAEINAHASEFTEDDNSNAKLIAVMRIE